MLIFYRGSPAPEKLFPASTTATTDQDHNDGPSLQLLQLPWNDSEETYNLPRCSEYLLQLDKIIKFVIQLSSFIWSDFVSF